MASAYGTIARRNSLTPPQEDREDDEKEKEQNHSPERPEPLTFMDDEVSIANEDEVVLLHGDMVHELHIAAGTSTHSPHRAESSLVLEAVYDKLHELNNADTQQFAEHQMGEDSVSISLASSRPPSTRRLSTQSRNVHFSMKDIEEDMESADEADDVAAQTLIEKHHNLLPSQIKNGRRRSASNGNARNAGNAKRRRKERKLRLSKQNLREHEMRNGLMQTLQRKVMSRRLERSDVRAMSGSELSEMSLYLNTLQTLILDEKRRRECCVLCNNPMRSLVLLLPCRHQNVCAQCESTRSLETCPTCGKQVRNIVFPLPHGK